MTKRIYDITVVVFVAAVGFPMWLAILLLVPLGIYLHDKGPVIYKQKRVGINGCVFEIYKYRSMSVGAEEKSGPILELPNDSRVTKAGKFLRRSGIDELPQIINVLKGDMSLVGPRPERPELVAKIKKTVPEFDNRLAVLPGIWGLAYIRGDYWTTPRNKLRYDMLYIKKQSIFLDTKILFHELYKKLCKPIIRKIHPVYMWMIF